MILYFNYNIIFLLCIAFNIHSIVLTSNRIRKHKQCLNDVSKQFWNPEGLSQQDLMITDKCIEVNENDQIIGPISKLDAHKISNAMNYPKLHRAFSVFLFNDDDELLLQQRAHDKITFPGVWSNTCCSHQLYGCVPNEIDNDNDVLMGNINGTKNAIQRKLLHELGIESNYLPINKMKYLTRIHYYAKDIDTYGSNSEWGEHEIDYIIFLKVNNDIVIKPNKEEVSNYKWVNKIEFDNMISTSSGLKWSPWFRVIADKHLSNWWKDLDITMNSDKYIDFNKIYRY